MFYKYCNFLMLEGVADGKKYAKGDVTPFMIEKMSNVLLFFLLVVLKNYNLLQS